MMPADATSSQDAIGRRSCASRLRQPRVVGARPRDGPGAAVDGALKPDFRSPDHPAAIKSALICTDVFLDEERQQAIGDDYGRSVGGDSV